MQINIPQPDSILVNDKIYYSESYIKLQMHLEYQRGYNEHPMHRPVIHRAEIIECTNCSNKNKQD
jgi:hypothetical protein